MIVDTLIGYVTNNDDPDKRGKIRVSLEILGNEEYPEPLEPWLPPGMFSLPQIGEQVEVILPHDANGPEAGLVDYPEFAFWRAVLIDDEGGIPSDFETNYTERRGIFTPGGHILFFDDNANAPLVELRTSGGHVLRLADATASKKVELKHSGGATFEMTVDGNVTVSAKTGGTITLDDGSPLAEALAKIAELNAHIAFMNTFILVTYNLHNHPTAPVGLVSPPSVLGTADLPPKTGTTQVVAK